MQQGQVKKWLPKGYGFIAMDDGMEIFVHCSACGDREFLNIGENVSFDLTEDERSGKMRASNVKGEGNGEAPDLEPRNRGGYGNDNGYGNRGGYRNANGYGNRDRGDDRYSSSQTKVCYQYRDDGNCRFGDRCRFSHQ